MVKMFQRCEQKDGMEASYTEKTERHEACGYGYTIVRTDGETFKPNVCRGENAADRKLLQDEANIRESLATLKPLVMRPGDWVRYKSATHWC